MGVSVAAGSGVQIELTLGDGDPSDEGSLEAGDSPAVAPALDETAGGADGVPATAQATTDTATRASAPNPKARLRTCPDPLLRIAIPSA